VKCPECIIGRLKLKDARPCVGGMRFNTYWDCDRCEQSFTGPLVLHPISRTVEIQRNSVDSQDHK
jgi:transcriptional regulator NrdR family protein